jgi:NhaA family Na+:H+ antiporter
VRVASNESPVQVTPGRGEYLESLWIEKILRRETIGGLIIVGAAFLAVILANSPLADAYFGLRSTYLSIGFGDAAMKISVGHFTADGLLAIFFFLVGLELKREFISGELRDPRKAIVPVVAAVGGVIVPAVLYVSITQAMGVPEAARGWAIPIATDIAFALAVLALVGTWLPLALRTFLLTLAVVDDLIGITVIAIFYADELHIGNLALSLAVVVVYGFLVQRYQNFFAERFGAAWLILLPMGVVAWFFMYGSGVHATIAGVLLAFTVPVLRPRAERKVEPSDPADGLAGIFEHRFRPFSAGVAVPLFAFFAAGVSLGSGSQFVELLFSPVSVGIIVALVVGKTVGVVVATWLITRLPGLSLPRGMAWIDLVGIALLAGIGFTVSLLIGELSFGLGTVFGDEAKLGILVGSVIAALLAAVILGGRNRYYRSAAEDDARDENRDGIPDVFQKA